MPNTEKPKATFPVTIQVERDALASTLISAIEFGIYYWARDVDGVIPDDVRAALTDEQRAELKEWGSAPFAALTPGCHVELVEHGGDDEESEWKPRRFTHAEVSRALGIIAEKYRWHLRTVLDGGDSESGDVLFQLAALDGEAVYG